MKLDRAEHHLRELQRLVDMYKKGRFYHADSPDDPEPTSPDWRFVLHITKEPDPEIAIVLGDFLFNTRSALDHIAVAVAPSDRESKAGFPIQIEPPNAKRRQEFNSRTQGMPPEAIEIIEREQPYNMRSRTPTAGPQALETLFGLHALQNADEHRRLSIVVPRLSHPRVQLTWPEEGLGICSPAFLVPGDAIVSSTQVGNRIPFQDLTVELEGVSLVAVEINGDEFEFPRVAEGMLERVRDRIIPALERFARA